MAEQKRVLILSMLSGFGHIKAGQALQKYAAQNLPNVEVTHVDVSDINSRLKSYAKFYEFVAKKYPVLWSFFYNHSGVVRFLSRLSINAGPLFDKKIRDYLITINPDVILFTNVFIIPMLVRDCQKLFPHATLAAMVTDYHGHPYYNFPEVNQYFVPAESIKQELSAIGVPHKKITVTGMPISPEFYQTYDIAQLKNARGIKNDLPVVLLIGSFRSSPQELVDTVDSLLQFQPQVNVIFVAAGDKEKYGVIEKKFAGDNRVVAIDWTNDMHELMALADVVVGKSGGLTVSECLHLKKPIIIIRPIPGQEEHNAVFVEQHNRGKKIKSPHEITVVLADMLALSQQLKTEPLDTENPCQKIFEKLI